MKRVSLFKKLALFGGIFVTGAAMLVSLAGSTTAEATSCVKGTSYADFKGTVVSKDTITVQTKDGGKLCNDVQVNFSSFKAPLAYDGKGFSNNPTAIPQYKYANKTVTLKKGTNGKTTVTIAIPDECTPYQIDAYLGPVQDKILTSKGLNVNGRVGIVGKLYDKTKTDCTPPEQVKACNMNIGLYEMVDKGKENTPPYTTNTDYCEKVTVCNTKTGEIEKDITKQEAKDLKYADANDEACNPPAKTTVCDTSTTPGKVVTINKDVADADTERYVAANDDACKTTEVIPSTGPVEIISSVAGMGSLAGAGSMYIKSRRTLFRK